MSAAQDLPVMPGQVVANGKYRVDRVLGIGGMGVVVAATHIHLSQLVAIKFMLPAALADHESRERFLGEARSAAQLKSEHVARVLDVGSLDNGAPYIVMEYLEGITLDTFLERGNSLSIGEAVEYTIQACEAVAEAHVRGIIHRDLKPTNLFLTQAADKRPLVKVIDFGLSKTLGANDRKITKDFSVMGTPTYMSPEQLRSTTGVDTRTDIWSLGVVLYELLSGHVPFHAESVAEVCSLVLGAPPKPIQSVRADVPPGLALVIERCLEKDPNARFESVAALAEALDPFLPTATAKAGDRIRRVQTESIGPRHISQSLSEGIGRKTEASWGTDGMHMLGPKPNYYTWIAVTALIAAVGVLVLVLGLLRARAAAPPPSASLPPPDSVVAPPPSAPGTDPVVAPPVTSIVAAPAVTPTAIAMPADPPPRPARPAVVATGTSGAGPRPTARPKAGAPPPNRDKLLENR